MIMMTIMLMIDDGGGTVGRMCRGDWSEELHDRAFHGSNNHCRKYVLVRIDVSLHSDLFHRMVRQPVSSNQH